MAKADKAAQLELRDLSEQILINALPRVARVLKPWPKGAKAEQINEAVAALAQAGLVHAGGKSPNLTPKGIEVARELSGKTKS